MSQMTEAVDHEHDETLQSLRDRCKHLENMLNFMQRVLDDRNATITDLQGQLEAVGAGGIGPLVNRRIDQQLKPVGYAYLCNQCLTPIDDNCYCPSCGHNAFTKLPVWASSPQPEQQQPADNQITDLAHRMCWRYRHSSDPNHSHTYTFNRHTLLDFARTLREGGAA